MKVCIEVQRLTNGYVGLVRALNGRRLVHMCEHVDNPHSGPGKAVQCAEELARSKGHVVYEV